MTIWPDHVPPSALEMLRQKYRRELTDLVNLRPTLKHQTHYSIGAADQAEAMLRRFIEEIEKIQSFNGF